MGNVLSTGLNKIVHDKELDKYFIIRRNLEEIRSEKLEEAVPSLPKRPLVFLSNVYEAIERCLFFYERGVLPLIGEPSNPAVTLSVAGQYKIDGLIIDHVLTQKLKGDILGAGLPLKSVLIIDSVFDKSDLDWRGIESHFILSTPETGSIGYLCKAGILHPFSDVHIEPGLARITSDRFKASPVKNYQTSIFLEKMNESRCQCGKESFMV